MAIRLYLINTIQGDVELLTIKAKKVGPADVII